VSIDQPYLRSATLDPGLISHVADSIMAVGCLQVDGLPIPDSLNDEMVERSSMKRRDIVILFLLTLGTCAVYVQTYTHEFLCYDDTVYVTENRYVRAGLTFEGMVWALTGVHHATWHPLTSLSHMLDVELFGLDPRGHHMMNVVLHVINAALLFWVLRRMTGASWPSGFVAALFAVHPAHVESVAWVAERKDLLSTFFWMLTMLAYLRYTEQRSTNRYVLLTVLFVLGLMAKPMVVTLPFVLLLMDYWPLGRFDKSAAAGQARVLRFWPLVREKVPLFGLTLCACAIAIVAQRSAGSVRPLDTYPLSVRIGNSVTSYLLYVGKALWPSRLAVFYPFHTEPLPLWQFAGATATLLAVTTAVFAFKRYRYMAVGWLWYLGTLVPVIGIVQIGSQAMADRYTYIPFIGLFIMAGWGLAELAARWRNMRIGLTVACPVALALLMLVAWRQTRYWHDSEKLFQHAVRVTSYNSLAHLNLGFALLQQGRTDEAVDHFSESLRIKPDSANTLTNLGIARAAQGRFGEAIDCFSKALALDPRHADAHYNMGVALARHGDNRAAAAHLSETVQLRPDDADARVKLGILLMLDGNLLAAREHFQEALRLRPDSDDARGYLDQIERYERSGGN